MRTFLLILLMLGCSAALPARAQSGAQQTETYFGCALGQILETAPDPRLPTTGSAPQRPGPRLIVRCVSIVPAGPPICPQGTRVAAIVGADICAAGGNLSNVTDGTSNTISVGETRRSSTNGTIGDGTSNTISVGEARRSSTNVTMGDGSVRTINASESAPPPAGANGSGGTIVAATVAPTGVVSDKPTGTLPPQGVPAEPACVAPNQRLIDPAGAADLCAVRSFSQPADRVPVAAPR